MSEQIKKAIFRLEQSKRLNEPTNFTPEEHDITLQTLQAELDRQENKPLTLSELKEMVGEPVWCKADKTIECHVVELDEVKSPGLTGISRVFLFKHLGETWNAYKHKPTEGV